MQAVESPALRGTGRICAVRVKPIETMPTISRRSWLAGSAALIAAPALRLDRAKAADVDVAIVGAGAAGIAAARRIAAARLSVQLIEADNRIGGRCVTDTTLFGVPFDLGAHWLHSPDSNPLIKLAPAGLDIYPAPRELSVRVGPRDARDSELENFLVNLVRARRAFADAGKADISAQAVLPKDLGVWQSTIAFVSGAFATGKDLNELSAQELARAARGDHDAYCRQGYGALLARLAAGLPVHTATPASKIVWQRGPAVETPKGTLFARAVIVTVSTNLLAQGKLEFVPPLPKRHVDAAARLSLGSYDHIALDLPGNPLGLQPDELVFEQAQGPRTAALLANVGGSSLHLVEVAGAFGRALAAQGEAAMVDFAGDWLAGRFGTSIKSRIKRGHATNWNASPFALGAMAAGGPGAAGARAVLAEPLGRVWFAGEALHETEWGTVAGAWSSGERTAEVVLRHLGAFNQPPVVRHPPPANQRKR
jgi:monoamine oxidase